MKFEFKYDSETLNKARLTKAELKQYDKDCKSQKESRVMMAHLYYAALGIQRLLRFCSFDAMAIDTLLMELWEIEKFGDTLPKISLSITPQEDTRFKKLWRTRSSFKVNVNGTIYRDYHKDPLWKGFQGAIFMMSSHIQDLCLMFDAEIARDPRYDNEEIKFRRKEMRRLLEEINDRDVNLKTGTERLIELWDGKAAEYKRQVGKETRMVFDVFYAMYEGLKYEDPFVYAISATAYTLSSMYKKAMSQSKTQLELKYQFNLEVFLKEFEDMANACVELRKGCDKVCNVSDTETFAHDELPYADGLTDALTAFNKKLCGKTFWTDLMDDHEKPNL